MTDQKLTFKLELVNATYCVVFSDGMVLKSKHFKKGSIDFETKKPMLLENFKRPDDRWLYYGLWSDGCIQKQEVNSCQCLLPKKQEGLSPVDYEMYVLLLDNWVKKGEITYLKDNRDALERVVKQFEKTLGLMI